MDVSPSCLVMSDRALVWVTDMAVDKSFEAASQTMVEYETLELQASHMTKSHVLSDNPLIGSLDKQN